MRGIADELYGLVPAAFTAERNARVKELRSRGDKALAALVGRLPKPSVAAWAANTLVRERAGEIGDVLSLGALLRDAQDNLDPAALRTLGAQRRQLVAALGREAGRLAAGRGQPLSGSVVEEIEHTLQAAMTDPAAAAALRTGRLLRSLSATGLEVDLTDAVAVPEDGTVAAEVAPHPGEAPAGRLEARAEKERRERAERELAAVRRDADDAEKVAREAERAVAEVDRRRGDARTRRGALRTELRRLKAEIAEAEDSAATVEEELQGLEERRDAAVRAAEHARLAAEHARAAVLRAEERRP